MVSSGRGCDAASEAEVWCREWRKFKNGARKDKLELGHWVKATADPNAGT